jgi:biopolymer transport protein ExbB/TolQ
MKRQLTIAGIVVGAILALGPLWGMLGTAFGMQRAFATLAGQGIGDPRALSSSIGAVLLFQAIGFIVCPFGIALCIFSVIKLNALHRNPPPLPPAPSSPSSNAPFFKE